ncbi:hypothetical protein, partial [Streptomyces sp. NPDC055060]
RARHPLVVRGAGSGGVAAPLGGGRPVAPGVALPVDKAEVAYAPIGSRRRLTVHPVLYAVHGNDQKSHGRQEQKSDN